VISIQCRCASKSPNVGGLPLPLYGPSAKHARSRIANATESASDVDVDDTRA